MEFKPTLKKPTKMGKKFEKKFNFQMQSSGAGGLNEVDTMLNEKEQSFKKKIWDLAKMESLVHADPKLSAKYNEMSEDGEDKYGYHYNETIMNILFNDYVMNSQTYLQKYKNAIPAEKKRRDKSGINQLQQKGEEKMDDVVSANENDETTGNFGIVNGFGYDQENDGVRKIEKQFDTMKEQSYDKNYVNSMKTDLKARGEKNVNSMPPKELESKDGLFKDGVQETTGAAGAGQFAPPLGFKTNRDLDESGDAVEALRDDENKVDETTTSASSGAFVGPFGTKRHKKLNKPAWDGGQIIGENYLTDIAAFKKIFESFENEGMTSPNDDSRVPMAEAMNPASLKALDTQFLQRVLNSLMTTLSTTKVKSPEADQDISSIQQELRNRGVLKEPTPAPQKQGILGKVGSMFKREGVELTEHHLNTKDEKIQFIIQNTAKSGEQLTPQELAELPDETIDVMYNDLEKSMGMTEGVESGLHEPEVGTQEFNKGDKVFDKEHNTNATVIDNYGNPIEGDGGEIRVDMDGNVNIFTYDDKWNRTGYNLIKIGNDVQESEEMIDEKSKSKSQQRFMGMVHAAQKGELENPSPEVAKAASSMSGKDAKDFAQTKHAGLPEKIEEYSDLDKEVLSRRGRKKVTLSELLNWANDNVLFSTTDVKPAIEAYAAQKGIDVDTLRSVAEYYLENNLGYQGSVETGEQDVLVDLIDNIDEFSGVEEPVANDASTGAPVEEAAGGDIKKEIGEMLGQLLPHLSDDLNRLMEFTDMTVNIFFNGDYNKAYEAIKKKLETMTEGIINSEVQSMIGDNPTSMAATMKDVSSPSPVPMGEGLNEGTGSLIKLADFAKKYNIQPTGNSGKFKLADFTPVITTPMDDSDLYDLGVYLANMILGKQMGLGWDDLSDTNSLWDYVEGHRTMEEFIKSIKSAVNDRLKSEEFGDMHESKIYEDGHCRKDEKPVAGKVAGKDGSCEKKDKIDPEERKKNKHNVESRIERERQREKKMEKREKELIKKSDDDNVLDKNKTHMKKLKEMVEGVNEDKRPSALVQMDRLHKENEKNFKSDMSDSNTDDLKTKENEMEAMGQYTEVGDNPYELGEKIEKEKLAKIAKLKKDSSFNNVGDSTNDPDTEIPKRNMTASELEQLNLDRGLGMQDIVYDNKPAKRFVDRMKKDMGQEIYDQAQKKMEYRKDAPMYNKDTQPVAKGLDKLQFDKNVEGYNDKRGIKTESVVTGKYRDEFNKVKFIDFKINEAVTVEKTEGVLLSLDGLGNVYSQKIQENSEMRDIMNSFDFYLESKGVVKTAKKQTLTESKNQKPVVNEQLAKMKKLFSYDPSKKIDTSNVKKNRGF